MCVRGQQITAFPLKGLWSAPSGESLPFGQESYSLFLAKKTSFALHLGWPNDQTHRAVRIGISPAFLGLLGPILRGGRLCQLFLRHALLPRSVPQILFVVISKRKHQASAQGITIK